MQLQSDCLMTVCCTRWCSSWVEPHTWFSVHSFWTQGGLN